MPFHRTTARLRRDTVSRPTLLARLTHAADTCPLTLLCAPGGSGKATLLSRFATVCLGEPQLQRTLLWVSMDDDDNVSGTGQNR